MNEKNNYCIKISHRSITEKELYFQSDKKLTSDDLMRIEEYIEDESEYIACSNSLDQLVKHLEGYLTGEIEESIEIIPVETIFVETAW